MNKLIVPSVIFLTLFLFNCSSSGSSEKAENEASQNIAIEEAEVAASEAEAEAMVETSETEEAPVEEVSEKEEMKEEEKAAPAEEAATPSAALKTLTTSIPPVSVVGTPAPIKVPNLKAKLNRAPAIQVPDNTKLLSKGKTVTSSDDFPIIGELELITDGEKDAGEGYYLELLDGLQWVQIDLEKSSTLEAVWVWHYHAQDRAYHDVVIQVSDDAEFSSGVTTIFNNDYDNSASLGKGSDQPYVESNFGLLVNAKKAKGRYVRLYSNNNSATEANNYIEVEVYGVN